MKEIINELIDKKQQLKEEIERKGVDMSTATFSDYGDKIREIGEGSLYVSPLSQLGYSKEDEEFYSDLDFGTFGEMIEDFEYSREQIGKLDGVGNIFGKYSNDTKIKYMPWFDASNANRADSLFNGCTNLKVFPRVNFTSLLSNAGAMFHKCAIERIDCTDWDIPNVTVFNNTFLNCANLKEVKGLAVRPEKACTFANMFQNCSSLTSLDVSNWNTSNVTNMSNMFNGCSSLANLDVSNWNTSNVTNMSSMFNGCSKLESLDVSNWDVGKVTTFNQIFYGCFSLKNIDVKNWNTSGANNMYNMFARCQSVESLSVGGFDTSNVTNMGYMFYDCQNLKELNAPDWNTEKLTSIQALFYNCPNIEVIDISGWDLSTVNTIGSMVSGCKKLDILKMKGFGKCQTLDVGGTFTNVLSLGSSPEGLEALRNTLIRDSFDRASAGYSAVTILLPATVKARLTTDEIAQITAKGFTIA
jgi:surface protein